MIDLTEFRNKRTYDAKKIEDVSNILDFFKLIGLDPNEVGHINVMRVAISYSDKMLLHDAMIKNCTKNKRGKNKKRERDKAGWEWLMLSPESSEEIPSGEVWYKDDYTYQYFIKGSVHFRGNCSNVKKEDAKFRAKKNEPGYLILEKIE